MHPSKSNFPPLIAILLLTTCFAAIIRLQTFAQSNQQNIDYYYDSTSQRLATIKNGEDHTYYLSPSLQVTVDNTGKVSWQNYTYFMGKPIAVTQSDGQSPALPSPTPAPTFTPAPAFTATPNPILS